MKLAKGTFLESFRKMIPLDDPAGEKVKAPCRNVPAALNLVDLGRWLRAGVHVILSEIWQDHSLRAPRPLSDPWPAQR
jgi:hypothetical protein